MAQREQSERARERARESQTEGAHRRERARERERERERERGSGARARCHLQAHDEVGKAALRVQETGLELVSQLRNGTSGALCDSVRTYRPLPYSW